MRSPSPRVDVSEFLELLNSWPVANRLIVSSSEILHEPIDKASSNSSYAKSYSESTRSYNSKELYTPAVKPEPMSININDIDSIS